MNIIYVNISVNPNLLSNTDRFFYYLDVKPDRITQFHSLPFPYLFIAGSLCEMGDDRPFVCTAPGCGQVRSLSLVFSSSHILFSPHSFTSFYISWISGAICCLSPVSCVIFVHRDLLMKTIYRSTNTSMR